MNQNIECTQSDGCDLQSVKSRQRLLNHGLAAYNLQQNKPRKAYNYSVFNKTVNDIEILKNHYQTLKM